MANQSDPESCVAHREVWGEALTGETGGPAIEPRNHESGMPMLSSEAEGNTGHGVMRQSCPDPARSKTLSTPGSRLHGSWEVSSAPDVQASGGTGKSKCHNPVVHADEKSDTPVVPRKPSNKGGDLYSTGAVTRALGKLIDANGYIMVYGRGEHVDADGRFLHAYPDLPPEAGLARFADGCFICQPTVLFRRSMWLLLGKLDASLATAFDFDYWLRAFLAFPGRIGFVDAVQAQSRLHDACITRKMRRSVALDGARLLHRHLGRAPRHWILTHMEEARTSETPELAAYLQALVEDASPYYPVADIQALHAAAAQAVRESGTGTGTGNAD
jgi:hypothetical protein